MPAVVQQHDTGEVLMLGWMDDEALHRTLTTGRGTYWSRSRREYWVKGETSGNTQRVVEVRLDCDGDTVLLKVDQTGPACHTGAAHLLRRATSCSPATAMTDGRLATRARSARSCCSGWRSGGARRGGQRQAVARRRTERPAAATPR